MLCVEVVEVKYSVQINCKVITVSGSLKLCFLVS